MIPLSLLRHQSFFKTFDDRERRAIAALAHDVTIPAGTILFRENDPATHLFYLLEGAVDLYLPVSGTDRSHISAGEIAPGEPFGVSALLDPYVYKTYARASVDSRMLKVDALALRELIDQDCRLGMKLLRELARAAFERVEIMRLHIAALSYHSEAVDENT